MKLENDGLRQNNTNIEKQSTKEMTIQDSKASYGLMNAT